MRLKDEAPVKAAHVAPNKHLKKYTLINTKSFKKRLSDDKLVICSCRYIVTKQKNIFVFNKKWGASIGYTKTKSKTFL